MIYELLADLIVAVHFLFILFVIGGEVAIILGVVRRWSWVRNLWFRLAHVLAIVIVAMEAVTGVICPLTTWEWNLRERAGQIVEDDISFVGRLIRDVLYYELPPWVFTTAYVAFALLVIVTFIVAPPRRKHRGPAAISSG